MITSLRNRSYEERLAQPNRFSLEKRRLRGKIIECFKIFKGFTNVDLELKKTWITLVGLKQKNVGLSLLDFKIVLDLLGIGKELD